MAQLTIKQRIANIEETIAEFKAQLDANTAEGKAVLAALERALTELQNEIG